MCGRQGSFIVIIGGTNWEGGRKNWLNSVRYFDSRTLAWTPEAGTKLPGGPLAYGVLCQDGEFGLTVLGGSDGEKPRPETLLIDGIKTFQGSEVRNLGGAVVLSSGGEVLSRRVIVGGTNDAADLSGLKRSAHEIVFIAKPWLDRHYEALPLADYPGKPFAVAASTVVGDELFIFGGMNHDAAADAPVNSTEAYAFSPAKNTWRKLHPLAVPNRGLCAVTLDDHRIYLAGGYTDDFTADAVIYDVKADSYTQAKPLPYAAMVGLVKLGGYVYCLGGEDKKQSRTDKCYRISWEALRLP